MRPLKASLFFVYCLVAITAVGTAVSHLWNTSKLLSDETAAPAAGTRPI